MTHRITGGLKAECKPSSTLLLTARVDGDLSNISGTI